MKRYINQRAQNQGDHAKRFIINLILPKEGPAQVRSCEIAISKCRNRTSFTNEREIADVFEPSIATGLKHLLEQLSSATRVLSLPEHALETRGLILAGVHLISNYAQDGTAVIILRFKQLIGSVHNAFVDGINLLDPVVETRDDLALQVLTDLSLPLLDICSAADAGILPKNESESRYYKNIAERAEEIRFQVELIKRYLDGLERQPIPVSAHPQRAALFHARP